MIVLFVMLIVFIYLCWKYNPHIDYIEKSKMWVCFYNKGNSRQYFVIFKDV